MKPQVKNSSGNAGTLMLEDRLREDRTLVMGVLNVTPDSFSDGGRFVDAEDAVAGAGEMVESGADIIDIGAESSRPGAAPVSSEKEKARLETVLPSVCSAHQIPVSIDTYKSDVARWAIENGAAIVNDITGLRGDAAMADVVADTGCYLVIMHMLGTPQTMQREPRYDDVVDDIKRFFEDRISVATDAGIGPDRIWLDPGIGFGKTLEHNLEVLRRIDEFACFGCPVLVGTSRKSFIGTVLNIDVEDRVEGTGATVVCAVMGGARVVRVHDIKPMVRIVRMVDAVLGRNELNVDA